MWSRVHHRPSISIERRSSDLAAGPPPERTAPVGRSLAYALDGIRVLDLGTAVAGPFGTMLLGDLGADVIKIEPVSAAVGSPGDATWVSGARGKRCIAVNLKEADGQEILRRLIATADVLHYNLRPGVAERLGFGYEEVRKLNPSLVFCHLTAYGSTGPMADQPGTDQMAQALCGLEYEQGASSSGGHPTWYRFGMTDAVSGMLSVLGVVQALYRREQSGEGQVVETDILSAGMLLASDEFVGPAGLVRRTPLDIGQTGLGPYYRLYETQQGWVCIAALGADHRERLHRVLGLRGGIHRDDEGAGRRIPGRIGRGMAATARHGGCPLRGCAGTKPHLVGRSRCRGQRMGGQLRPSGVGSARATGRVPAPVRHPRLDTGSAAPHRPAHRGGVARDRVPGLRDRATRCAGDRRRQSGLAPPRADPPRAPIASMTLFWS